jgi:hypothetical protein
MTSGEETSVHPRTADIIKGMEQIGGCSVGLTLAEKCLLEILPATESTGGRKKL